MIKMAKFGGRKLKRLSRVMFLLLVIAVLVVVSACQSPAPAPAPAPVPAPEATPASIAKGGLMYDKWWKAVEEATEPTDDHPLWALQSTNERSISTTWRCKECHGWDYQGKDGAYSKGSHFTGFPGIYTAAMTQSKAQLLGALTGGVNADHDFSSVLSKAALEDLVNFLKEGPIDNAKYIDYETKKAIGANISHGLELYTDTCTACHGADGKQINFGDEADPEYVGTVASGNPWEALHKIRFGQPGTSMPSAIVNGWSIQDVLDVLGYTQTLPTE